MNVEAKTVDDSRVETVHIVRPNHLNGANRLFGGILMQWIDEVAGIVAKRHSMCNVTTFLVVHFWQPCLGVHVDGIKLAGSHTVAAAQASERTSRLAHV